MCESREMYSQGRRKVGGRGKGGQLPPPLPFFDRLVNPFLTKGAYHAHKITTAVKSQFLKHLTTNSQGRRKVGGRRERGTIAPLPPFHFLTDPFLTKGADYAHQNTTGPPDFCAKAVKFIPRDTGT